MTVFLRCSKQIAFIVMLLSVATFGMSQQANRAARGGRSKGESRQLKRFIKLAGEANVTYTSPEGFKEIKAINNDTLSFDYGLALPGEDFEVWFEVQSQKKVLASFARLVSDTSRTNEHPDSLYNKTGLTLARQLSGGQSYFTTIIPPDYLARYNADEGKTYLIDLADARETRHYKYALLITLHKDHVGTIVALCLGNEKGSEFFKNIFKVSKCLRFKS